MLNLYRANTLIEVIVIDNYNDKMEYNFAYDIQEYAGETDYFESILSALGDKIVNDAVSIIATCHTKINGEIYFHKDIIR